MKIGTGNNDIIFGTQGNDDIWGMGGDDILLGGAGNDTLNGGSGADTMQGGLDNDTYIVDNIGDKVIEYKGEGYDTVRSSIDYTLGANVEALVLTGSADLNGNGNELNNDIYGNSGNNILKGGGGSDWLYGNGGSDTLVGGDGWDYLYGGTGDDVYVTDGSDFIGENAGEGIDTVYSSTSHTLYANVENLYLTGNTASRGTGNDLDNIIHGNDYANVLDGGAGADTLYGGLGDDIYKVDNVNDKVIEHEGEGQDQVWSTVTWTLGNHVEDLWLKGSANIDGYGNMEDNKIWGNSGNNVLYGYEGNDTLDGGAGADTMYGGKDDDTYVVDNAGDVVVENAGEGNDKIYLTFDANYKMPDNVESLSLGNYHSNATGNASDNKIFGGIFDNVIDGGAGADQLWGNGGNDTFVFHAGEAAGDKVMDFSPGDMLTFVGYGSLADGATFHQLNATQWEIGSADGAHHDIITMDNGASLVYGQDFQFA